MKPRALIAAGVALIAVAAGAPPASADGFTLQLDSPRAVVGDPMVLEATGTIPLDELQFPYWFSLDAIPTALTSTCPQDRWEAAQFANAAGGAVIVLSQRVMPDSSGRFTVPVAINPTAAGQILLCGYTDDGLTTTLARASLLLTIEPAAPSHTSSPPVQLTQEIRGCHALLGGAAGRRCVRAAVRRAKAGCRHYPSPRRQTRCLRKVRRITRRNS
jgi:hypothetical protein